MKEKNTGVNMENEREARMHRPASPPGHHAQTYERPRKATQKIIESYTGAWCGVNPGM